jgi:tetratricopeptide (TPR) repeat protein
MTEVKALNWEDTTVYYDDHQHYLKTKLLKSAFDQFWALVAGPETPEADLFGDLSFFDSHSISVNLLQRPNLRPQSFNPFKLLGNKKEEISSGSWMDPIFKLEYTSLLNQLSAEKPQVLWIHELVQTLSRDQVIGRGDVDKHVKGGTDRLQQAVVAANEQLRISDNSTPCEEILRHIQSILTFMKEVKTPSNSLKANLLDIRESVIELLWKGGWYRDALVAARDTFNTRKDIFGQRHRDHMKSLNIYIKALLLQGEFQEADDLILQAFQTMTTYRLWYPSSAIEYLKCLDNYSIMLRYKGEYEEAVEKAEQAYKEAKAKLGAKHRHALKSLLNLALAYQSNGCYDDAVERSQQALDVLEPQQKLFNSDDLDTLASRDCYASTLYHQGFYAEAERQIERALSGRLAALGERHPDTLSSLQNSAAIYRAQGKYQLAKTMAEKAYQGRAERLGEDHPDTLASIDCLALIHLCQGEYDLAEKEALKGFCRGFNILPGEHPALFASMRNVAAARRYQGHFIKAKEAYEDVLKLKQMNLRSGHPDTLISLRDSAWILSTQGNYTGAASIYEDVYQEQCEVLGIEHPETLATLQDLAVVLVRNGKYEQAKDVVESAWISQEESLGVRHPDTLTSMHIYAIILRHQRLDEDAASLSQQVWRERERILGGRHPDTLASLDSYASALQFLGQYGKAEAFCKQGLLWRQEIFKGAHPDVLASLDTYSSILRRQNKDARSQTQLALEITRDLREDDLTKLLSRYNHGLALHMEGDSSEAYKEIADILNVQQSVLEFDHPDVLSSSHQLGLMELEMGLYEQAGESLRETFDSRKHVLGQEHPDTLETLSCYCLAVAQQGQLQLEQAKKYLNLQVGLTEGTPLGLRRIKSLKHLSNPRGVSQQARVTVSEKITKIRIALTQGALHKEASFLKVKLALTLLKQAKWDEAEQELFGVSHPDKNALLRLSYLQQGKTSEAQATLRSRKP